MADSLSHRRCGSIAASLIIALFAPLWTDSCLAFSYRAMSEVEMTAAADAIVVGVYQVRDHDGKFDRTLVVDRVLKGEPLAQGARLALADTFINMAPEPQPRDTPVIAWLSTGREGTAFLNFSNSVRDPTPQRVAQISLVLDVLARPAAQLQARDDVTAEALCHWTSRAWFTRDGRKVVLRSEAREADGLTREQTVKLLCDLARQASPQTRALALGLLAPFEDPSTFDVFVSALDDRGLKAPAARGLKALHDRRAVPHLVRELEGLGDDLMARMALCDALAEFRDPAAVPVLLEQVRKRYYGGAEDALMKIHDPRAVPVLLEAVWRDGSGVEAVLAFDDPSVVEEARRRMYDHPSAPHMLAVRGDPVARPLMLKLIRQRDPDGEIWARKTSDPEAAQLASEAKRTLWPTRFLSEAAAALDDPDNPRAVILAARLLQDPQSANQAVLLLEKRLKLDAPPGVQWPQRLRLTYDALLSGADRFGLSPSMRHWLESVAGRPPSPDPHPLPAWPTEWPQPNDAAAKERFVRTHREAFAGFITDPDVPDVPRADVAARLTRMGMYVLDEASTKALLREPGFHLHYHVLNEYAAGRIALGAEDIRAVFTSPALSVWLHNVAASKRCGHPEILQELVGQDWAQSVDGLHAALRATHHDAAIPRLRELLVENTINVRREAAVTLALLGDATGSAVIDQEVSRYRGQKYQFHSWGEDAVKAQELLKRGSR